MMRGTRWLLFGAGFLAGTAGIKLLSSKDATLKENCDDILADAKEINEARAAAEDEIIEDASDEVTEG